MTFSVADAVLLLDTPFALSVWLPMERFGTVAGRRMLPFASAVSVVQAVLDVSQERRTCSLAWNPPPLTVRLDPTAPEVGLNETTAAPSTLNVALPKTPPAVTPTG